jgi:hypothetical protein
MDIIAERDKAYNKLTAGRKDILMMIYNIIPP